MSQQNIDIVCTILLNPEGAESFYRQSKQNEKLVNDAIKNLLDNKLLSKKMVHNLHQLIKKIHYSTEEDAKNYMSEMYDKIIDVQRNEYDIKIRKYLGCMAEGENLSLDRLELQLGRDNSIAETKEKIIKDVVKNNFNGKYLTLKCSSLHYARNYMYYYITISVNILELK